MGKEEKKGKSLDFGVITDIPASGGKGRASHRRGKKRRKKKHDRRSVGARLSGSGAIAREAAREKKIASISPASRVSQKPSGLKKEKRDGLPEPPCDWFIVTSSPVFADKSGAKKGKKSFAV